MTYCPLHNMLEFHSISGLGEAIEYELKQLMERQMDVYMFPDYDEATQTFDFYKPAGTRKVWDWLDRMIKGSDMREGTTPHSIRASGCIWALRCFAETEYVRKAGRWSIAGRSFGFYFKEGSASRDHYLALEVEDPVFSFRVWKYNVLGELDN